MKRHPALQDLSRDHHVVLVHCQSIRKALQGDAPSTELRRLRSEILGFYESDLRAHFKEEDEIALAAAERHGNERLRAVALVLRADHARFRQLFEALDDPGGTDVSRRDRLAGLARDLTEHVWREERELFEGLQSTLTEPQLQALWRRSHAFRRAHRSPQACGLRPPVR